MIEIAIKEYLQTKLGLMDIYMEMPADLPDRFVVMSVADRGRIDKIDAATIEFSCYAGSKYQTAVLDEELRAAMDDIAELNEIGGVQLGGSDDQMDSTHKRYRYRCFYNIYY